MLKDRTLKSLLEDPLIADIAPDAISKMDLSKEEYYSWTLREIADRMGWRSLERGFSALLADAARGNWFYQLYSEEEIQSVPSRESASMVYFPSSEPSAENRPFILLVPGGGFVNVWNLTEGWPVAQHFNELGYHVFILTYQVGVKATALAAMADAARAMKIIHARRDEFRVNPDRYITCGFSAGGYIVCLWNTEKGYSAYGIPKPEACIPVYPLTSFRLILAEEWDDEAEKDEFACSGVGCTLREACSSCFEIPAHVDGFPPTALFLAAGDELVDPQHSRSLAEALEKANIPCRLEIGDRGGHGFADGAGMCMEGWIERAVRWIENEGSR